MMPDFIVTIDQFEGPLDLMLHLIRENKLNLFHLDVLLLTNQYVAYIKTMEQLNLEVASEYLVEMANLLEYKSKKLLPKEKAELAGEYQEANPEDLVLRLLEYRRYQEISKHLELLASQRERLLEKTQSSVIDQWLDEAEVKLAPMVVHQLFNAMERCQKRLAITEPLRVKTTEKEMTVDQRIRQVLNLIKALPESFSFDDLCSDAGNRMMIVMTFLAILEMLKNQVLAYKMKAETIIFSRGKAYV